MPARIRCIMGNGEITFKDNGQCPMSGKKTCADCAKLQLPTYEDWLEAALKKRKELRQKGEQE